MNLLLLIFLKVIHHNILNTKNYIFKFLLKILIFNTILLFIHMILNLVLYNYFYLLIFLMLNTIINDLMNFILISNILFHLFKFHLHSIYNSYELTLFYIFLIHCFYLINDLILILLLFIYSI